MIRTLAILIVLFAIVPAILFWLCRHIGGRFRWKLFALLLTAWCGIIILPAVFELPNMLRRIEQTGAKIIEETERREATRLD